jgi:hypothetical protein
MASGNKNKRGTSGRGSNNQSNQSFTGDSKYSKSGHNKNQTGEWPSETQQPSVGPDAGQNRSITGEESRQLNIEERTFNLLVDSVPYMVKVVPFRFNDDVRFRVSFNGSPEHVFTWDSSLGQLRAIDDDSSIMPDNLELAISEKLQSKT